MRSPLAPLLLVLMAPWWWSRWWWSQARTLWRDARAGELRLLWVAVTLAVAALIDRLSGIENEPMLVEMRRRLEAGETLPFDAIRTPADGVAQVFLTFASALATGEDPDPLALIHARLAGYIAPDLGEARLIAAFDRVRNHFGLGRIAQAGALAALVHPLAAILPFVELGGFIFTFLGDGRPGTGKTTLIQMMAGLINDYCTVAGYPFRYANLGIDNVDSYQGKSGQNARAFIDSVIEWTPKERIVARKLVSNSDPILQGHFPGNPILPGVVQVEAMAQAAVILAQKSGVFDPETLDMDDEI